MSDAICDQNSFQAINLNFEQLAEIFCKLKLASFTGVDIKCPCVGFSPLLRIPSENLPTYKISKKIFEENAERCRLTGPVDWPDCPSACPWASTQHFIGVWCTSVQSAQSVQKQPGIRQEKSKGNRTGEFGNAKILSDINNCKVLQLVLWNSKI